jgi:peptidoglycan L-alanyl-D-glutamate endopeptidase CwlK
MELFVDPHGLLGLVHPDLVKVIQEASQTPQPFEVIYGIRSSEAEQEAVASGHSTTMHSRHLPQSGEHFRSCAVDVAALEGGKVSFAPGREEAVFGQIAKQIQAAADELKIPIEWGGAAIGAWAPGVVSHFRDWGHFQLPWKEYP